MIDLPEFTPTQVQDLAQRWQQEITEQQIKQLITLLGGHPYRLQLAFYYLHQQTITLEELLEDSAIATNLYAEHLQQQWNLQRYPELWASTSPRSASQSRLRIISSVFARSPIATE